MVEGAISNVTVMAYRTDAVEVERIAEGWLSWGVEQGLPVGIALENGTLPAEIHRTFARADRGNVMLDRAHDMPMVQMFAGEISSSYTKPTYSFSHEVEVLPSRISFMDDRSALATARKRLDRTLSSWDSFDGLLVHGLIVPGG
jgi:hypothetical protein